MQELREVEVLLGLAGLVDSPPSTGEVEDWMQICLSRRISRMDFNMEWWYDVAVILAFFYENGAETIRSLTTEDVKVLSIT